MQHRSAMKTYFCRGSVVPFTSGFALCIAAAGVAIAVFAFLAAAPFVSGAAQVAAPQQSPSSDSQLEFSEKQVAGGPDDFMIVRQLRMRGSNRAIGSRPDRPPAAGSDGQSPLARRARSGARPLAPPALLEPGERAARRSLIHLSKRRFMKAGGCRYGAELRGGREVPRPSRSRVGSAPRRDIFFLAGSSSVHPEKLLPGSRRNG